MNNLPLKVVLFFLSSKRQNKLNRIPSAQVDGSLSGLDEAAIIGADDADAETNGRTNEWWHLDDSNMTVQWIFGSSEVCLCS